MFGEGRFPTVSAGAAIPEPARAALTKLAAEVVRSARLRPAMRHVLEQGLSARSACVVCSVRDGHLCADVLPAKWCLPALDDRGCVVSLEVRYKFDLDGEEFDFYDDLTRYVEDQSIKAAAAENVQANILGFQMAMLQRRFASSMYAVRRSLERMRDKRRKILDDPESYRQQQIDRKRTALIKQFTEMERAISNPRPARAMSM